MSGRFLRYEDYFRVSNSAADQNHQQNDVGRKTEDLQEPEANLKQAAALLVDKAAIVVKSALQSLVKSDSAADVMSEIREQGFAFHDRMQNEQFQQGNWNPQFDDRRQIGGEPAGIREPECLRPLETCESYESNWSQQDNRRQGWERGSYYQQAEEDYVRQGRWENERDNSIGQPGLAGYDTYYRQQHYDNYEYDSHQGSVGDQYRSGSRANTDEHQKNPNFSNMTEGDHGNNQQEEEDEEDTSYCKLCDAYFDTAQKYFIHTRGMLHTQRQMAANSDGGGVQEEVREQNWRRPQQHSGFQRSMTEQRGNQFGAQQHRNQTAGTDQEDQKQEEEDDDDDEDTTYCKLCDVHFDDPQKYFRHTRGLLHTQRQVDANKAKLGVTEEEVQQQKQQQKQQEEERLQASKAEADKAEADEAGTGDKEEDEEEWDEEWTEFGDRSNIFTCVLCDIQTTGIQALRSHENGRAHKSVKEAVENGTTVPQRIYSRLGPNAKIPDSAKPVTAAIMGMKPNSGPSVLLEVLNNVPEAVVGTAFVKEGTSGKQASFLCTICESMCDAAGIASHLIGSKHRMKYLRAYHPSIYEHVRSHGGKKSQLSAFLEQVCADVEKKEGRKKPIMEKPAGAARGDEQKDPDKDKDDESAKSNEKEEKSSVEEKKTDQEKQEVKKYDKRSRQNKRHLPHHVVMAMYEQGKNQGERFEPEGQQGQHGEREGRFGGIDCGGPGEPFRFGMGRGNPPDMGIPPDMGMEPYRHGLDFRLSGMGRDPYFNIPRSTEPYRPPFLDYPNPFLMTEEERLNRMYEYENHLFNHPMLLATPEEARCRMFDEYERLGIPYDIACDRILIQEERRVKLMEYMKGGVPLKDAQSRLKRLENRKRLIREYEQQGLQPREARWRAIVEEERNNLYEKYEKLGFSPMEARVKIMSGEDRMHLIQEFERHGMTPEEAHKRAVNEEDRLKSDVSGKSGKEQSLDDVADRRMLQTYMEQGDTKEQAENKVIAVLRRQGVPTQEAILRVQKIEIKVPEKHEKESLPRSHDDHKKSRDKEKTGDSKQGEDFDKLTPEEAKERLFQEYEKRGVPREKARMALIQELVKSGVPEEEARRRFSDTRPTESASREGRGKRKKPSSYERSRSRSSSSSGSSYKRKKSRGDEGTRDDVRSDKYPFPDERRKEEKSSMSRQDERMRADVHDDRFPLSGEKRTGVNFPDKRDRVYNRGLRDEGKGKDEEKHKEPSGRPTLTLGEELKEKARRLKRAELLGRLEETSLLAKQCKPGTSQSPADKPQAGPSASQSLADRPRPGASKEKTSVSNLLESLTDNLISSEDHESALSMSKALTSALLKYRLNTSTGETKPSGSMAQSSFVERRIQDAKKLFETKMLPPKVSSAPLGSGTSRGGYGGSLNPGLQPPSGGAERREMLAGQNDPKKDAPRTVRPESFGLPPPLPAYAQNFGSRASQPTYQHQATQEKKPIVPRVLLAPQNPTKGKSSSAKMTNRLRR